eukprot:162178_1
MARNIQNGNHLMLTAMEEYYQLRSDIGKGSFGTIIDVECIKNGSKYVAKIMPINNDSDFIGFLTESSIMNHVISPFCMSGQTYFSATLSAPAIVMEKCIMDVEQFCEVREAMHTDNPQQNTTPNRMNIMIASQLLEAILAMHNHGLMHRDIKPANILLSKEMNVKLADYNLSKETATNKTRIHTLCGTPAFVAPEIHHGKPYNNAVDIFSYGAVLLRLAFPKFYQTLDKCAQRKTDQVIRGMRKIMKVVSDGCYYDMFDAAYQYEPQKRSSAEEISSRFGTEKRAHIEKDWTQLNQFLVAFGAQQKEKNEQNEEFDTKEKGKEYKNDCGGDEEIESKEKEKKNEVSQYCRMVLTKLTQFNCDDPDSIDAWVRANAGIGDYMDVWHDERHANPGWQLYKIVDLDHMTFNLVPNNALDTSKEMITLNRNNGIMVPTKYLDLRWGLKVGSILQFRHESDHKQLKDHKASDWKIGRVSRILVSEKLIEIGGKRFNRIDQGIENGIKPLMVKVGAKFDVWKHNRWQETTVLALDGWYIHTKHGKVPRIGSTSLKPCGVVLL